MRALCYTGWSDLCFLKNYLSYANLSLTARWSLISGLGFISQLEIPSMINDAKLSPTEMKSFPLILKFSSV
jgi:hypothetical protein